MISIPGLFIQPQYMQVAYLYYNNKNRDKYIWDSREYI